MLPTSERSYYFYVYEILSAYARFSDKIGIGRAGLQCVVAEEGAAVRGQQLPMVKLPPLFSTYLSSLLLISEETLSREKDENPAHGDCPHDYPYPASCEH